tara:strand:+ start:881 stop:1543 length:663 start_codon:yes stop_codon:yes gene_type:complete
MTDCKALDPFLTYENDLVIQMIAGNHFLVFRDGIDSFDRSYSVSWDSVNVYGRQDPIQTYQSTGESINVSWPLKPDTDSDYYNDQLKAILALGKFVRPFYSGNVIKESPLLLIRYRNLIVEEYADNGPGTPLLIAPTSISVNYGDRARDIDMDDGSKILLPKRVNISLGGMVINRQQKYYDKTAKKTLSTREAERRREAVQQAEQLQAQYANFFKAGGGS